MINLYLSLYIAKLTHLFCRLLPGIGGSALPGLIALKINPNLINQIREKNHLKSIVISGTNGKTTTTRLLSHILTQNSTPFIHNRAGSNLLRGVASTLINQTDLLGQTKSSLAIWEIDEAILPQAIIQLQPQTLLLTNLFRDQLDRYGEINTVLANWRQGIKRLPKSATLILNIDDPSLNYLAKKSKHSQLLTYGLSPQLASNQSLAHTADAIFCPDCLRQLNFDRIFTSHLGHYHCSRCRFKRLTPTHTLKSAPKTQLSGTHNLYNLLAAATLAQTLKIPSATINQAIASFKPAFGRGERFKLNNTPTQLLLVKNPTGFNTILETLKYKHHLNSKPLFLLLNDLIADGTDVSWIWDVEFELLKNRKTPLVVSGLRAHDLALRLKYAGLDPKLIILKPDSKLALQRFKRLAGSPKYILPTYTAMLRLRQILAKQSIIHSTWKD